MKNDYNFQRLSKSGETCWDDVVKRFINEMLQRKCITPKKDLEWLFLNYYALPNSPALLTAGNEGFYASACSSYPIYDTMHDHPFSIVNTLNLATRATKAGVGCGFNFSRLRAKSEPVGGIVGLTGGPVSFLKAYSGFLGQITQATRKSANMGLLHVNHLDIGDFINCKKKDGKIDCFNLSIILNDKFMNAVMESKSFRLHGITHGLYKDISATDLFNMIAERIWDNGEPGVFFEDAIRKDYFQKHLNLLANPCSEAILSHGNDWLEMCVLASINLPKWIYLSVKDKIRVVQILVSVLNDIIDVQDYVMDYQKIGMQENRKIGIGIAGLATELAKRRIKYSSKNAYDFTEEIFRDIGKYAIDASNGRNKSLISQAPTSTLANIFDYVNEEGCSYGIEPFFSLDSMIVKNSFGDHKVEQKIVKFMQGEIGHVECANDLDYKAHLGPVEAYYKSNPKGVVQGCSKTINFKNNITVGDVKEAIIYSWKHGIKAISFYRDGSRKNQVMNIGTDVKMEKGRPINIPYQSAPKRPKFLPCEIFHTQSEKQMWIVMISLYKNNPYEVFIGKETKVNVPKKYKIGRVEKSRTYNLILGEGDDELVINDIPGIFENEEHATLTRTISMSLRHGVPLKYIVQQLLKDGSTFDIINKAIARVLKKYIPENENANMVCPSCKAELIYVQGCPTCRSCGFSQCG